MPNSRLLAVLLLPPAAAAQTVPHYVPLNPAIASRSAVYFQPFVPAGSGTGGSITVDYANAVEPGATSDRREYIFDSELMQVDLWITRNLSDRWFLLGNLALRSAHDGFLDSFLNGYHDVIGFKVPARNRRPLDTYGWQFSLPGREVDIPRQRAFLGDLRLGAGHRIGRTQVVATVTLPTATNSVPEWSRGTIGTALNVTSRVMNRERISIDAGGAIGWTPVHGDLADHQRTVFLAGMGSVRWRALGSQVLFGSLFVQSANWKETGFTALEGPEITLDFGALLSLRQGWPLLQVGMTEDLLPRGPAVDADFRLGVHW
ncbi:MAG TPA: DUF3187 family protein [Gemmatimonadales bacterium]|nr:DUF3187 family protein [Gemmatimonadales bacterium]